MTHAYAKPPVTGNVIPFPSVTRTVVRSRRARGLPTGVADFTKAHVAREWAEYRAEERQTEARKRLMEVLDDLRTLAQAEELDELTVVFRTRDGIERQVVIGPARSVSNRDR